MMRSLYSGVSGLKVHQTKMDVIGNNIANVNTVGFKGSNVTFSDVFYQTTATAAGPNGDTGLAGRNAVQIGLGANLAAISANMTVAGGSQRTDNPFDVMISGEGFFVVNRGGTNYFTKSGAFKVDAAGTLCTSEGANVMGWQVDKNGNVIKGAVSPLKVMSPENMYAEPEATTQAYISGNIDQNDAQLSSEGGFPAQVSFYDQLGNSYTAQLTVKQLYDTDSKPVNGQYSVSVKDVVMKISDTEGQSIFATKKIDGTYAKSDYATFTFGGVKYEVDTVNAQSGDVTLKVTADPKAATLAFNPSNGSFSGIYAATAPTAEQKVSKTIDINLSKGMGDGSTNANAGNPFPTAGITVDFSSITRYATSGTSKLEPTRGSMPTAGGVVTGAGLPVGNMTGISIDPSGKIYGTYDNGTNNLLGQIVVATFANPSGLEAVGDRLFAQTKNSGEFDGVGEDPTQSGGGFSTGVLEMSNVDLSTEFTNMITTQRGFQANSRIITTSDTLLEELINLKR